MSFIDKIIGQDGGEIRLVKATEKGKKCWFYLKIYPTKWPEYKSKLKHGKMDVADYGEILESGWGDFPSKDVIDFMKKEYDFDTPKS